MPTLPISNAVEPSEISALATEATSTQFNNLDQQSSLEIITAMNEQDRLVSEVVASQLSEIARAVDVAERSLRAEGRLIYLGCGTAGRLGVLDASECPPTFGSDPKSVIGVIAGGDIALRNAVEGAEDDKAAGAQAIDELAVDQRDTVIGIAASGRTPYTVAALAQAKKHGATTVAIVSTSNSPLATDADIAIEVITGPEVVAGSTRLKAGTAQKLVLNMISTATMVRLGKTYGNRMIDLKATNAKLHARAISIVSDITGVDHATAQHTLLAADGQVKTACLMLLTDLDASTAQDALTNAKGQLRVALNTLNALPTTVGLARTTHARSTS